MKPLPHPEANGAVGRNPGVAFEANDEAREEEVCRPFPAPNERLPFPLLLLDASLPLVPLGFSPSAAASSEGAVAFTAAICFKKAFAPRSLSHISHTPMAGWFENVHTAQVQRLSVASVMGRGVSQTSHSRIAGWLNAVHAGQDHCMGSIGSGRACVTPVRSVLSASTRDSSTPSHLSCRHLSSTSARGGEEAKSPELLICPLKLRLLAEEVLARSLSSVSGSAFTSHRPA
mmetsp:Transcript_23196/g.53981  ORF Transcript_23196/g.53981 Transcript_23196/m.53981 type:complete len:231 (+) Transcript_23196:107-799(+)